MSYDYKKAGVDTEAGDALVDWLQTDTIPLYDSSKIVSGIGGFASLFRLDLSKYKKPCLVTCTDGVGTKVLLAAEYGYMHTVAQDMVAMCVNDLITTGADPLVFLDYYATGKLDLTQAKSFLEGVKRACLESECTLVGGETAEMPGVYKEKDFDCAGFAVGLVDEDSAYKASLVQEGDVLIGISSNGFHSNGYSLLRRVFKEDMDEWIEILMRPTHLYVKLAKSLRTLRIHGLAHITGGGIENIPRVIPSHYSVQIQKWQWPREFLEVQKRTQMTDEKMLKTLNCGVGLVVVASKNDLNDIVKMAQVFHFDAFEIGRVIKRGNQDILL